ncbi:hypothetical protein SAMN04487914_111100 [Arthrobacter sp. ok909]|nr:hypothetical protein SAMN04487914_111100 [Arthrobacter sp. ok909]
MSLVDGSVTGRVRNGPLPCSGAEFFVDEQRRCGRRTHESHDDEDSPGRCGRPFSGQRRVWIMPCRLHHMAAGHPSVQSLDARRAVPPLRGRSGKHVGGHAVPEVCSDARSPRRRHSEDPRPFRIHPDVVSVLEEELGSWMRGAVNRDAEDGWSGIEVVKEVANTRNGLRHDRTLRVLFAYGRIDPSEVKAAMAKHDFKSLCSAPSGRGLPTSHSPIPPAGRRGSRFCAITHAISTMGSHA